MQDISDIELLQDYHRQGSEKAFAELVQRHINLVYSVARRHAGVAAHAEEITQAVFVILARKAARLRPDTVLEGWLYETTRLTSLSFLRGERRRLRREQEAYMQSTLDQAGDVSTWNQMAPMLDEAMAHLAKKDRDALILRYFNDKKLGEVAAALNVTEAAAQSRVQRALQKLHRHFSKRGVSSTTGIIAGELSTHSVHAAPALLAKSATAVAITKGAAAGGSTLTLIKGALKLMAWTKAKTIVGIGILLVAGTGTVVVKSTFFPGEPSYQGRRLSEWLVDINYDQPQDKRTKAQEAVRHMGVKTLPYLLADLDRNHAKDNLYGQVTWAFDALGPIAKPAIPKLTNLLEQNPGYVPLALTGIGPDAMPEIMNALTNGSFWVRDNTAAGLANAIYSRKITPDQARDAFPVAINNLTYTNDNPLFQDNTRWRAASLLDALNLEPDISVPALIRGLENTNFTIAAQCAYALGNFRNQARPAVPMLIQSASSTNRQLNLAAKMALDQIQKAQ